MPTLTPNEANVISWILGDCIDLSCEFCEDMEVDYYALQTKLRELAKGATNV